ncbi:MAG: hypothetical protein ACYC61_21810 [Isosphaeraceae bacterium]
MRNAQMLVVGLSLLSGYVLAMAVNRPIAGQSPSIAPLPDRPAPVVARYQTTIVSSNQSYPLLILTDTATGHCWVRESGPQDEDEWRDLGAPASARR